MSDRERRELERRLAAGDPSAADALLALRLRAGDLAPARVRLLARLGDEGARRLLGGTWPAPPGLDELFASLRPYADRRLLMGAVLAAARLGVDVWRRERPGDDVAPVALAAAEAWWEATCAGRDDEALATRAQDAAERALRAALAVPEPARSAGRAASEPAATIAATGGRFLSSAELVLALVAQAGIPDASVRGAVLSSLRAALAGEGT